MAHLNEQTLRAAYAAFANGDLNGYLQHCTENISFRVPGKNKVAGTFSRAEFFSPFISTVMGLTNGTFHETVIDILANDQHGCVLLVHEFERNGIRYTYNTAHIYKIIDGKLDLFQEYPEDQYYFDQAWE